jgi:hypothetical protein
MKAGGGSLLASLDMVQWNRTIESRSICLDWRNVIDNSDLMLSVTNCSIVAVKAC